MWFKTFPNGVFVATVAAEQFRYRCLYLGILGLTSVVVGARSWRKTGAKKMPGVVQDGSFFFSVYFWQLEHWFCMVLYGLFGVFSACLLEYWCKDQPSINCCSWVKDITLSTFVHHDLAGKLDAWEPLIVVIFDLRWAIRAEPLQVALLRDSVGSGMTWWTDQSGFGFKI